MTKNQVDILFGFVSLIAELLIALCRHNNNFSEEQKQDWQKRKNELDSMVAVEYRNINKDG